MPSTILTMGLPGAGKTTLARALAGRLNAVHINADEVRATLSKDLGFSIGDRIEHARRMRRLCEQTTNANRHAIADFVCPTEETRAAFGPAFIVWVDRIREGRFPDTNRLFEPPEKFDVRVTAWGSPEYWAGIISSSIVLPASTASHGRRPPLCSNVIRSEVLFDGADELLIKHGHAQYLLTRDPVRGLILTDCISPAGGIFHWR